MKIFNQLNIVDHTGHGIPIIINKYGKEAFDIHDNYIMVTIPFNKDVVATMNVGVNVSVNKIEKFILKELLKDPTLNAFELSLLIGKSKRTVERYLKSLKERGYISREGADKNGLWRVLK